MVKYNHQAEEKIREARVSGLKRVCLEDMELTEVPESLWRLKHLEELHISGIPRDES
jgi:hypothetical protein